ncbi:4Fe-4S binding protein [Eubacteriales bacterium OttesenSCG-928-N13]|nr:4Fe-4S binding protein [Eubacteriales bacterium OttesenSCG-928-N13]
MANVSILEERCKGCMLCIQACPKKILQLSDRINQKGYHPIECSDMSKCIGCAFCARMCPDCVIVVEK